jgi:lipoprotein-anchoring transpeptidase ErfK/SrfK
VRHSGVRLLAGIVAALALAACSAQEGAPASTAGGDAAPAVTETPTPTPVTVAAVQPPSGALRVRLDARVEVTQDGGTLTSVEVRSAKGTELEGEFGEGRSEWHSTGVLAPATSYTVKITGTKDGESVTQTSTFTTLKPAATNSVKINTGDGKVYGVGMPIIITFEKAVKNTKAVADALTVKTTPEVEGSWHWMEQSKWIGGNTQIWYRPKTYWPKGTKVSMTAALGQVETSPGVWGRRTYTSAFTIGDSVISTVDLAKHTLTMKKNGAVVKTIPITGGKAGPKWSTRNGIKVIMDQKKELKMDSSTLGITDENDADFYSEIEHWTQRLTLSGEFLHARPGSEPYFGRANVSHGCTGMTMANAQWLFEHSSVGDVVIYTGGSRSLEWGNGYTLWMMSYPKWAA